MNYNTQFYGKNNTFWSFWIKIWRKSHLDLILVIGISILILLGLFTLYSASSRDVSLIWHQLVNFVISFVVLLLFAQIPVDRYKKLIPWVFVVVLLMLFAVASIGVVNRGVQRWLNLGLIRFQPSELMKIVMPMMIAWYLHDKKFPLGINSVVTSLIIIVVPVFVIAKQPDLGTAVLVAVTGVFVLFLAGITWKIVLSIFSFLGVIIPVIWNFMHAYQKMRILSFLSPENDPLGSGYNMIQSKIAIGSGGWFGKGWLQGSQTYLQFLPVRTTDFIFAVYSEEFGLVGCLFLFGLFSLLVCRSLYIGINAQNTFSRLLVGSVTLSFFTSFYVNVGMVTGVFPVVGIPLPLVSYGGSSFITFMVGFGIIMSVHTHRKLIGR